MSRSPRAHGHEEEPAAPALCGRGEQRHAHGHGPRPPGVRYAKPPTTFASSSPLARPRPIHTEKAGEPAVLGVITTATYGYTRKDGIQVIPVAALRP